MPRKSVVNRNNKRKKSIKQLAAKRAQYKANAYDSSLSFEERLEWHGKLQALPRDSSATRYVERCRITGRARGVYSKFGICRNMLRLLFNEAGVTGLVKSSW